MAISIITEPGAVSFSRQPIKYVLETNNHQTVTAEKHASRITFTASTPDTSTLTFVWGGNTVVMTATTGSLDAESTNFSYNVTLATHITNLVARLNSNYKLSKDFVFMAAATYVEITAREEGVSFEFVVTSSSGNASQTDITNGVDAVYRENFKILVEVWTRDAAGNFFKAITEEYDVDSTGLCEFDISEVLHSYLESFLINYYGAVPAIDNKNLILNRFYIRYAEKFGDPQVIYSTSQTDTRSVLRGSLSDFDNLVNSNFIVAKIGFETLFLKDSAILHDVVTRWTYNKLVILCNSNVSEDTVYVNYKLYFDDSTTDEGVSVGYIQPVIAAGEFRIIEFDASIFTNEWDLDFPTKTVIKYDIFLTNVAETVLDTVTFNVKEEKLNNTYFLYENSLGSLTNLWCNGEREEGIKVDKTEFDTLVGFKSISNQQSEYFEEFAKVNTGALTKKQLMMMKDFLFSENVLVYQSNNYIYTELYNIIARKVNINKGSFQLFKQSDDIYNLSFSYTFADKETGYSNLLNL